MGLWEGRVEGLYRILGMVARWRVFGIVSMSRIQRVDCGMRVMLWTRGYGRLAEWDSRRQSIEIMANDDPDREIV
jgi:hypothetical protein